MAGLSDFDPPPGSIPSPGARLLAKGIDSLVVGLPMALIALIAEADTDDVFGVLLALAMFAYAVVLEARYGQTFGKRVSTIEVRREDTGAMDLPTATMRNLWILLTGVPATLGGVLGLAAAASILATISSDPLGRGWHDRLAGSLVQRRKS